MRRFVGVVLVVAAVGFAAHASLRPEAQMSISRFYVTERAAFTSDGVDYAVVGPWLYRVDGDDLIRVARLYDPSEVDDAFEVIAGVVHRRTDIGLVPAASRIYVDFDEATRLSDVLYAHSSSPFHGVVLREPAAPAADDHYWGTACVLDGRCVPEGGYRLGDGELAFTAAAAEGIEVSKASLVNRMLHLVEGDDVWIEARIRVHDPAPYSLIDVESGFLLNHPGVRMIISDGALAVELKWGSKPVWRQSKPHPLPLDQWVDVALHLTLDSGDGGVIELYQGGSRVIDTKGQTLPLDDTIYDTLEVGVTANPGQGASSVEFDVLRVGPDRP